MKITVPTHTFSVKRSALSLLLLFTIFYLLFSILALPVHAAENKPLPANEAINQINQAAITGDFFDDKIFNLNQIAGTTDSLLVLLLHPQTNALLIGSGAIAASGKLMASLYGAPPASGVQYFAGEIRKFNPVQPAFAQTRDPGIGFNALQPVQRLWSTFRNISYVGFVLVFIVIGFMVMFRSKISPQAVATIQDSLPRIVVALILVTFSYAIVGLMIDVMFVFLNVIITVLKNTGSPAILSNEADVIFQKSVFGVVWGSWSDIIRKVFEAISSIIGGLKVPAGLDNALGFFGGGIAGIIAGIAILFIMFRVFFMLLMSYVTIIILTIFAPFLLLFQALPGNNGAKEWFKQLAANISVFPVVALMFLLAGILSGIGSLGAS
ncbi:hypothetical protein HYW40_00660, partial [Candidatus Curtissbacteria bacterium]|nr:hypothetical protein [Candidatus Curtissbacteria bacterium]